MAEKKFHKNGLTLYYRHKTQISDGVDRVEMAHPVTIDETQMQTHLLSLYYEEMALLGKKTFVFEEREAESMAPWLVKSLARVKPSDVIVFEMKTPRGNTVGQLFATKTKLHWRFNMINDLQYTNMPNPQWGRGILWKLVPFKGQTLYTNEMVIGKRTRENWLVADLELPIAYRSVGDKKKTPSAPPEPKPAAKKPEKPETTAAEPPTASAQTQEQTGKQPGLEEKLLFLKQLRDKQLIDDEEYKRKRKDVMDKYF
jgi:hypothetical protein